MPSNIIIDCERMKYHHTGLYHYCYNLGKNLIENHNHDNEKIQFFLSEKELFSVKMKFTFLKKAGISCCCLQQVKQVFGMPLTRIQITILSIERCP